MEAYEIIGRIERLREERGWTIYRLAEEACIAQSTLFNMNTRKTLPSITTLSCLCDAFGITLSEFFSEGEEPERLALYATIPAVRGYVWFSLNDYRTHVGEEGDGRFRRRVHGSVDWYGNEKPSYRLLQALQTDEA